jgi:hypothetical protein
MFTDQGTGEADPLIREQTLAAATCILFERVFE